jgi:hypothetical protein
MLSISIESLDVVEPGAATRRPPRHRVKVSVDGNRALKLTRDDFPGTGANGADGSR